MKAAGRRALTTGLCANPHEITLQEMPNLKADRPTLYTQTSNDRNQIGVSAGDTADGRHILFFAILVLWSDAVLTHARIYRQNHDPHPQVFCARL